MSCKLSGKKMFKAGGFIVDWKFCFKNFLITDIPNNLSRQ